MQSLKDLGHAVRRHPIATVRHMFTAFSVLFTSIQGLDHFAKGIKIDGLAPAFLMISVSIGYGLWRVWKPSKVDIKIATTNTTITILFGDIFLQDGIRAISVTEFFETEIGKPVSDRSLHGIFLRKCFGGGIGSLDAQLALQLKDTNAIDVPKRDGKTKSYPIGTCALISVNQDRYLLFAIAKADPETCKAYTDVRMVWDSISQLWKRARIEAGGYPVNLALVGSGLSGLGLPTRDILNLIILSAITETKATPVTEAIRIVLSRERFEEIDLREIKKHWER